MTRKPASVPNTKSISLGCPETCCGWRGKPPCACATRVGSTTELSGNLNMNLTCARPVGRSPKLRGPVVNLIRTVRSGMNARFLGKLVVVAGGTGGLGRAVRLAFLAEGAKVVVTYRDQKGFDALRSAAGPNSSSLEGRRIDVTDEAAVRAFVDDVLAKHGSLEVLVNSVGAYAGGVNLWEADAKLFDQMFALNMRPAYVL